MKAVGYQQSLPIENPSALLDIELPVPVAAHRDLLVEVRAISVNPVDVKVRMRVRPEKEEYKVLGWDAAGIVKEVGPDATLFKPGDEVYYAGFIARQGANSEFHAVAELVETGVIRTTADNELGTINATNLRKAHALIESGRSRGKIVLAGF